MARQWRLHVKKCEGNLAAYIDLLIQPCAALYIEENKAGYTATPVACGWAGAIFEVTSLFGQEQ